MKIFGSIQELVELVYRKGSNTVTLKPNTAQATDATFSLPNLTISTDTLVSVNAAATLKNKTINAAAGVDGNTVINVDAGSLLATGAGTAGQVLVRDAAGSVVNSKIFNNNIDNLAQIALSKLFPLTVSRALQSNVSGVISASDTTAVELGYLSGVTSGIQGQLTSKVTANAAISGATATKITFDSKGLVTAGTTLAASDMPTGIDATKIADGSVDNSEFQRLNGLTSSAVGVSDSQTLLSKLISSTSLITGALTLPVGSNAQRPGETGQGDVANGMIRYNSEDNAFEGYADNDWSSIGGGGTTDIITQVGHTFIIGDVLYLNGSTYAKANATAANTAEVVGVVSKLFPASPDKFQLTLSGEISGLTSANFTEAALPAVGEAIFLSTTDGKMTITEPSTIGQVSVPVGVRSVGADTMYVAPKRGAIVGGVNARTEVALTSGAVTNVQNVAGMTAGELAGWVFISSSPARRFYLSAKYALSGAGGDYNLSYQTTGDTPPAGFLVDITTTGMIRVTLPAASGSTSVINYALNAPAIGASFPLTVNASQVQGRTDGSAVASGYVGQIIQSTTSSSINLTSNAWTTISSITLSSGVWLIVGAVKFAKSGAVQTFANVAGAIGSNQSDISSNYTTKYEFRSAAQISTEGNTVNSTTNNFAELSLAIQPFYVRSDGANLYFGDGTTLNSGSQNLTLAMYCLTFTGGPAQAKGKIEAVRIA